ncbi:VOC family protein [Nocardioides sp. QY071]|uniref:VOC family protein n=1 Tax=Nocardioides sp. QY071 TaxID=3044187 RepID=UPI00249C0E2E|nr:VOC family protein [Nocardioides sp. QY071]WGY01647.1 VOC family protein [Nocardioides sp. QY071]
MKLERMELVGLEVSDLDAAIVEFGELLDTEFVRIEFDGSVDIEELPADEPPHAMTTRMSMAMDKKGYLELLQSHPPTSRERVRNIHFKVDDIEAAIVEMRAKGYRLVQNIRIGSMREAVWGAREAHGLRMCMVQYDAPSMIEAMLQDPEHP